MEKTNNPKKTYQFIMHSFRKVIHTEFYGHTIGGINKLICDLAPEHYKQLIIEIHLKLYKLLEEVEKETISWIQDHADKSTISNLHIEKKYQFNINALHGLFFHKFNKGIAGNLRVFLFKLTNENYALLDKVECKLYDLLRESEKAIINWLKNHQNEDN